MPCDSAFKNPKDAQLVLEKIAQLSGRTGPVRLMEVCGTHTMSIARTGLKSLLPAQITLLSGPGCPVCVTPAGAMDAVFALAKDPHILLASYGDLLRIPGTQRKTSLLSQKAKGARVESVYSPMDALRLAKAHPELEVVFLGVGFETTAPGTAACILQAASEQLSNFSVLCLLKRTEPALRSLIEAKDFGSNCVFKLIDDSFDYLKLCVELPLGVRVSAIKIGDRALEDAIWRSLVCIVLNNDYSFQDGMEIRVYPDRLEFAFKAVSARIERSKGNWYLSGVSTNGQLQDTFYKTHPDETGHLSSITEYMKGGPAAIAINENDFSVITLKLPEDANLTIEDTQNSSDKENDKENIPANLERNVKNSHAAADSSDNDNLKSDYNPLDYISSRNANDNVKNSLDKEGDNEKFGENLIPDGVILSDKEKRVFEVIAENPYLTRNEIMERTSIPPATLSRAVKHLKDLKLVNRVGSDKNGYWEITAGSSKPLHK